MTAREQWLRFYRHEYNGEGIPDMRGFTLLVCTSAIGMRETFPVNLGDRGKDWFGVEWVKDGSIGISIPDPRAPKILEDICDWREKVKWPDLDTYDFDEAARLDKADLVDRENTVLYMAIEEGPFERLHTLMGFEDALIALITEPEECEAFFCAFMEWRCRLIEKIKESYNPDIIMYHDDVGTHKGMFFSPELWERMFKPQLKKAVDKVHELGMIFEYHSCGKIEPIVPQLVEIGVDSWQGQAINDISKLKKLTAGKLEYHPIYDYQKIIADYYSGLIDEAGIQEYTKKVFLESLQGGHCIMHMQPFGDPATEIMFQENLKLCMQYARDPESKI